MLCYLCATAPVPKTTAVLPTTAPFATVAIMYETAHLGKRVVQRAEEEEAKACPPTGPSQSNNSSLPNPVRINALMSYLSGYNSSIVRLLNHGFTQGFDLRYYGSCAFREATNLKSAEDHPEVLRQKITKDVTAGRIAGPFVVPPFQNLQISPLGLVPKKEQGTFRMIHHLSFPKGSSINDGIAAADTYVHYQSIDDAIHCIKTFGKAALMSKSDIESAFRILPIHPNDYELLGMQIDGQFYYDKALPMGCSISCKLFEQFSTALQWILTVKFQVVGMVHVLDDFMFIGGTGSDECRTGSFHETVHRREYTDKS